MSSFYARRAIDLTFQLGLGDFGLDAMNTVKVSGLRVQVSMQNAGGPSMGHATVRVHGLTKSMMNRLAFVMRTADGKIMNRWNKLIIEAGDYGTSLTQIFNGQIVAAPIQLGSAPDSVLEVVAYNGYFEAVTPVSPTSSDTPVDLAQLLGTMAAQASPPYKFENNGVSAMVPKAYYDGSLRDQMYACVRDIPCQWNGLENGVLAIWPNGSYRTGETTTSAATTAVPSGQLEAINVVAGPAPPLVSTETGMIGYPTNWNLGVAVRTLFNPKLLLGKTCEVVSDLPFANGEFIMFDIGHELDTEMPGSQWETSFHGLPTFGDVYSP